MADLLGTVIILITTTLVDANAESGSSGTSDGHNFTGTICTTKDCVEASNEMFLRINETADPCEDFHQFACGGFSENFVIPDDQSSLGAFNLVGDDVLIKGKLLLESNHTEESFEVDNLAKDYYQSCMAQNKINKTGIQPALDLLKELKGWPVLEGNQWNCSAFNWYDYVTKCAENGLPINYLLDHIVTQDIKNKTRYVFAFDQPTFGMPRKDLIKGFDDKHVQPYYTYMVEVAKLFGANEASAKTEMKDALLFEIAIAKASTAQELRRDPNSRYNPTTVKELPTHPVFPPNFKDYLNTIVTVAGAPQIKFGDDTKIILSDTQYLSNLTKILPNSTNRAIANYFGWRVVKALIGLLGKSAQKLTDDFEKATVGKTRSEADWKRCVKATGFGSFQSTFAGLVGSMYVRKHFKPNQKKVIQTMISYIKDAFKGMLNENDWMDEDTKVQALKKLKKMDNHIAYPDEVLDENVLNLFFNGLQINDNDYFHNTINLMKMDDKKGFEKLGETFDPKNWTHHQAIAVVNAFYNPVINGIGLPAGILQKNFFNDKVPMYRNFAGIGSIIGHEITHGFDDRGRTMDFEGFFQLKVELNGHI